MLSLTPWLPCADPLASLRPLGSTYLLTPEYVDGFWVLDCAEPDEALTWGRKAALACRASNEARPFY